MTLDKCIVLRIGTLTGCPLCRESHPLCRLKNPTVISIWLLVGFHPATRSVQSTSADNTRKRVWQYIEKERKHKSVQYKWFTLYLHRDVSHTDMLQLHFISCRGVSGGRRQHARIQGFMSVLFSPQLILQFTEGVQWFYC